jgi:AGCS family alanine or glycine:cation symporter
LIESFTNVLFLWAVIPFLLGGGIYLTLRLGVVQLRRLPEAFRAMVAKQTDDAEGALSPFQAFMTALAASVGTGNIAGVATAIISGGPGALFWIWVYGFFATSIKFSEAVLGIRFRHQEADGTVLTGPMYYLRDGLKSPVLAWLYALVAGIAALTTTPFTQSNSMAVALDSVFGIPTWVAGIGIAVLTWAVIIRGVKSIGRAAQGLAPAMIALYLIGGITVIVLYAGRLPEVFAMVFREAFTMQSGMGFGMFMAIRYGIARGVYANEAGYGTAAVAYGTARSSQPSQQGLQAVMEVFIVSFVTATISR